MALFNKKNLDNKLEYYQFEIYIERQRTIRSEIIIVDSDSDLINLFYLIEEEINNIKSAVAVYNPIENKLMKYNESFLKMASIELFKEGKYDPLTDKIVNSAYFPRRLIDNF